MSGSGRSTAFGAAPSDAATSDAAGDGSRRHDPGFQGAATTRPVSTTGVVTDFDPAVGLGTVRAADGVEVGFHCTQIADGTRRIEVGAPVDFVIFAGRHGHWEAGVLRPQAWQ